MTYKDDVLVVLFEADEPLTSREVGKRLTNGPSDTSTVTKDLYDDDFVDREGAGKRGDAYRYELTGKGEARARDLVGDEPNGPTGLDALFEAEDMDYETLANDANEDDVEYGTRYRANINNVESYGVFVSLNDAFDDVTGLVHKSRIPNGHAADDFAAGDKVGVMLTDERDEGLDFEMVAALDTVRGVAFERHPVEAPEAEVNEDDEPVGTPVDDDPIPSEDRVDQIAEADVEDEDEKVEFPNPAALNERIADAERYVDGVEDRVSSLEDVVGSANVEREDARHRLRALEDAVGGADRVVAFDDKEFVETVLMVAQSDYGGTTKKRHVLSTLLGIDDAEGKGLLSRALTKAVEKTGSEDDHAHGSGE